jgi:hypothetical protein
MIGKDILKNYEKRGNASFEDNMNYLSDSVSHVEINRFRGAGDTVYQVVAKAKTINVITGEKSFVVWARREAGNIADALQKACDEYRNRICMGMPVEHEVGVPEHELHWYGEQKE